MIRLILLIGLLALSACASVPGAGEGPDGRMVERFFASDTDGDGVLSPSEAPPRLDFQAADTNADGVLTFQEVETFTAGLRR